MEIMNAILNRKSVRTYENKSVEQKKLEVIVNAGNIAPIFGKFHITVIANPKILQEINNATLNIMKNSGNEFLKKRAATEGYQPLYGAPVMFVLSAPDGNDANGFNMANVSCAAENMITEATELELGTCFVMGPMMAFSDGDLRNRLQIPAGFVPLVGVLAGYPAEALAPNTRAVSGNVTYFN